MLDCPSTAALPTAVEATGWAGPWELIWIGDFGGWSSVFEPRTRAFRWTRVRVLFSATTAQVPKRPALVNCVRARFLALSAHLLPRGRRFGGGFRQAIATANV